MLPVECSRWDIAYGVFSGGKVWDGSGVKLLASVISQELIAGDGIAGGVAGQDELGEAEDTQQPGEKETHVCRGPMVR
jgi:hypothetical protein